MELSTEAIQTLSVIVLCFGLLIFSTRPPDAILLAGVALLMLLGVISPEEALIGMSNEVMATVAVLFIVARGLSQTGVVGWISNRLLGRPKTTAVAQFRLMAPVAALSSLLNNTPVVAMMVPAVTDWAKRNNLSVSHLMIPLSYAAIIGGTCTQGNCTIVCRS
jgi:Na+/H+ antiporter NhaD/arsenite permease-like protein